MKSPALFDLANTPLPRGTTLIEASAGTGKTFTIAGLVLRLVIEHDVPIQQILVTTYTVPATAELRDRIRGRLRDALRAFAQNETDDGFLQTLLARHQERRQEICRRLDFALRNFDEAPIFSIHGFCHRMLGDKAFESGVLFDAELVPDQKPVRREIVEDFWRRQFYEGHPIFSAIALHQNIKLSLFLNLLSQLTNHPTLATIPSPKNPLADLKTTLAETFEQLRTVWREQGNEVRDFFAAGKNGWAKGSSTHGKPEKMAELLAALELSLGETMSAPEALIGGHARPRALLDAPSRPASGGTERDKSGGTFSDAGVFCEGAENHARGGRGPHPVSTFGLSHLEKFTPAALQKSVKSGFAAPTHPFFALCEKFLGAEADYLLGLQLEFIGWALDELAQRKIARNMLSFDDLPMRLARALQAPGGSELARNIRTRFAAALIDEFQDTDPVQYEIFRRIYTEPPVQAAESLTLCPGQGPVSSAAALGWLFFIGDPKQAIYGFRGADIFTYMTAADAAPEKFTLGTNWRSESGLVQAVNHLFQRHENPFLFEPIQFHPVAASGKQDSARLTISGKREAPFQLWLGHEPEPLSKAAATGKIVTATAAEISRLLGGKVFMGDQPLRPTDIAVLVATHRQAALMQEALWPLAIPSVLQSHASVFQAEEATELWRLLQAVAEPGHEGLLRTALALDILGWRGEEIAAVANDETAWKHWRQRFQEYHAAWRQMGFVQMFRRLLVQEKVRTRLLLFPNGERRLTNLLHLAELLHQAGVERRLGMKSLVKWLAENIADKAAATSEESELRLERDENAVRIVTMHKSKGLEYPVVFCPFASAGAELRKNEIATFHDAAKEKRLTQDLGSEQLAEHEEQAKQEKLAEKLRLLYVALTRAKNRCYLVWGGLNGGESSAPNYLFQLGEVFREGAENNARSGRGPGLSPEAFAAAAQKVTVGAEEVIAVTKMPEPTTTTIYQSAKAAAVVLPEREFKGVIQHDWRISSFSSLIQNQTEELPDHDAVGMEGGKVAEVPRELSGIFAFPRGARAGNCLHTILEEVDFQDEGGFAEMVNRTLARFGFSASEWGGSVEETLRKMVAVPLNLSQPEQPHITPALSPPSAGAEREKTGAGHPPGPGRTLNGKDDFTFSQIAPAQRLCELEFHFPIAQISPEMLRRHFAARGAAHWGEHFPESMERLSFSPARGFLKGFIDLVLQHEGRFYIVDWKSNWLGGEAAAYGPKAMAAEMRKHGYHLQYHLYAVALHRYLSLRLPGYDYEQHFGGVLYVFLRGVDPSQPDWGIFRDRPSREMTVGLSDLLAGH